MTDAIDIGHLREWIGREQTSTERLAPFPARALSQALDIPTAPVAGDALPLPWHWLHFLDAPAAAATGVDGHPARGGFLPPVPLPRRMWAASDISVANALVIDREATKTSRVTDVTLKEGRSGALVFVTVEHRYDQDGETCLTERQSLVYRAPAPTSGNALGLPGADLVPVDNVARMLTPGPVLLFRYSALTYNVHRIHYDLPYATGEEGYPGLVVHGPLIATLLLVAAREAIGSRRVDRFSFRAERPAFAGVPLRLCVREEEGGLVLESVDPTGAVGMRAQVTCEGTR